MLLEMLNREVPEPFVDHCRGLGAGGGTTRPVPAPLRDTPEDIAGQIAVIKKFEKTLRWVSRWAACAWMTAQGVRQFIPAPLWRAGSLKMPAATQPAPHPPRPFNSCLPALLVAGCGANMEVLCVRVRGGGGVSCAR